MRVRIASVLVIGLAVIAFNLPALHHPFLFDDVHTITLNPAVRQDTPWADFFTRPETFSIEARMYRPVLVLSYALNLHWGGEDPFSFHLVNLALHLLTCWLVLWLALLLPPLKPWAFWIALLFALHPIHTELINYISCRSALGASCFGLLSVASALQLSASKKYRPGFALLSIAAFAAALGFKDIAILVPAQVLLLDFIFFRQARIQNYLAPPSPAFKWFAATLAGLTLMALGYLALRHALNLETFVIGQPARPVWINLLTQTRAWVLYLRLLFWPVQLSLEHEVPIIESIFAPAFLASAALFLALFILAILRIRKNPVFSLAVAWFVLCLLPTSSIIPLNVVAADNRLYLSCLSGAWSLILIAQLADPQNRRRLSKAFLLLVAIGFAFLTLHRHPQWESGLTVWRDLVNKAPGIARGHVNYGIELRNRGRAQDAVGQYRWALRLKPDYPKAYSNLATAYHDLGRPEAEMDALEKALEADPNNVVARRNLSYALAQLGRHREAIEVLTEAVRMAPRRADLRYSLGVLYLYLGNLEDGARELEQSLQLNPDQPEVRSALEEIRRKQNQP